MSKYSELAGSFIRMGNFPLEANYIFPDEAALKAFFEEDINKATLHKGLLKIVEDDGTGKLALYWVTKKETNDDLEFTLLISGGSMEELLDLLEELEEKLEQEIEDRKLADDAIYGTEDRTEIPEDLNSILELAEAIESLREEVEDLKEADEELLDKLKATVGTEDDDIIEYLQTLDYKNLTEISKALHHFLNTIDDEDPSINTLPELQEFLRGFEYTHNLYECFVDFWNAIEGDPLPNAPFRTLRGIQDFVETLASVVKNRCDNLQTELDQTQVGVGLSGDGAYNPDKETYYLKDATSVMNALKILDSLINEAINNVNIQAGETESAIVDIIKEKDKTTIYAKVKLASEPGNDILLKNDGLYHNIDSEYSNGILTIKVNGEIRQQHVLGLSTIVESAKYDTSQEAIIIVFKLQSGDKQEVVIPVRALISEWEVDNSIPDKVVELHKEVVIGEGADKLSADVRLSADKFNIIKKDGNSLIVDGRASNIIFDGDVTVESKLNELVAKDAEQQTALDKVNEDLLAEITRAEKKEHEIEDALAAETNRATLAETTLQNNIDALDTRLTTNEQLASDTKTALDAEISRAKDAENTLQNSITEEAHTREVADLDLQNKIDGLNSRVSTNETNISDLQSKTSDLSDKLTEEVHNRELSDQDLLNQITAIDTRVTTNESNISDLQSKSEDLSTKLSEEINRALLAEHDLEDKITTGLTEELNRATAAELNLLNSIDAINTRLDSNFDSDKSLTENVLALSEKLNQEIQDRTADTNQLQTNITAELTRAESVELSLQSSIDSINEKLSSNFDADKSLTENVVALNEKLTEEINRALTKEQDLQNQCDSLSSRVDANDVKTAAIQEGLVTVNNNLLQEIQDRIAGDTQLQNNITAEETRAILVEQDLLNQINATNANVQTNANDIDTLKTGLGTTNYNLLQEIDRAKGEEQAIKDLIRDTEHIYNGTKSIHFDKQGNVVTADVKIAGGDNNIIKVDNNTEGIYATVDIGYNEVENKIWLITSAGTTKEVQLSEGNIIDDIYYDVNEKTLVLTFTANGVQKTTKFPVADLFNDWIVKNPAENSAIELHKEHNVKDPSSNDTPDVLSARLLIADVESNAAQIIANGLYVSNKETVANAKAIEELQAKQSELQQADKDLSDRLTQHEHDYELNKQEVTNKFDNLTQDVNNKYDNLTEKITQETDRAKSAELNLQDLISSLSDKLESSDDKNSDLEKSISDLDTKLQLEITRATAKEDLLDLKIDNVESSLNTKIENTQTNLSSLESFTKEELGKKLESVQLIKNDDLSYTILVDGISIGVINIPKDQFLESVTLIDNVLRFVFITSTGTTVTDISLTEVLQNALDSVVGDVANLKELLDKTVEKLNEEIIRATHREDLLEIAIQAAQAQADKNSASIDSINNTIIEIKLKDVEQDAALSNLSDKISSVETNITDNINSQISNLNDKLDSEIERSTNKDSEFAQGLTDANAAINNESVRAQAKESALETQITTNNQLITEKAASIEKNLEKFQEETNAALSNKIEVIELDQVDILNYILRVDGSTVGKISIPKDKYLQSVDLVGLTLKFVFNDGDSIRTQDIDLQPILSEITSSTTNVTEALTQLTIKLSEEISRAKAEESRIESKLESEIARATQQEAFIEKNLDDHIRDYNNPHKVTADQLGVYTKDWMDEILRDMNTSNASDLKDVKDKLDSVAQDVNNHINDTSNPHEVTKEQIGLGKVDNTTDLEKPISVAVQEAINKLYLYIQDNCPKLDDFNAHIHDYDNPHRVNKEQVGLGNVDNTSDMDKPISTATLDALNKKADIIHSHTMADITDLEQMPIIAKGFVEFIGELPEDPARGDKYVLAFSASGSNYSYTLFEYDADAYNWKLKAITTGGLTCVIDENVWKLNSSGPERILDASDYKYFYEKIYDETKDLIEDIDWEEDDATNETNGQIRLKITYKTKYGNPDSEGLSEVTNPYQAKAVKYIDIDKARFLSNAYTRPATQDDINKGYATVEGEPMLILVFTTGDHVAVSLKETMNIYDEIDTNSIDLTVTDWTGNKEDSYKIKADLNIAATKGLDNAISLHINGTNGDKGLYGTLHTLTTNSIALNPATGTSGQKYLTADLKIDNALNNVNDILLSVSSSGLSAQLVIGDYD